MNHAWLSELTAAEKRQFALIVHSAKGAGWIDPDEELVAARSSQEVVVSASGAGARTKRYANQERWLLDLLHDLAHGDWRDVRQSLLASTDRET